MTAVRRDELEPFVTLDGSEIREYAGPREGAARHQSLAEAIVPPGSATVAHLHRTTEELYLFLSGHGRMRLGEQELAVGPGHCVVIPPGTPHKLWSGEEPLVLLCCCAPAYCDADTELLE
jgi:mannose-6-phosphate isomerase-like protein (cupin superfamily)